MDPNHTTSVVICSNNTEPKPHNRARLSVSIINWANLASAMTARNALIAAHHPQRHAFGSRRGVRTKNHARPISAQSTRLRPARPQPPQMVRRRFFVVVGFFFVCCLVPSCFKTPPARKLTRSALLVCVCVCAIHVGGFVYGLPAVARGDQSVHRAYIHVHWFVSKATHARPGPPLLLGFFFCVFFVFCSWLFVRFSGA